MLPVNLLLDLLRQFSFMVSYVSRGSSFPQPLPSKQEEVYIRRAMEGDKEAQNVLIERNLRLVAHVAKKYAGNGREMDDLVSIGTIGLIKAVNTYNVDKGTQLATYAARCIENEILMTIRASKKTKHEISLQEPIGTDQEGNAISLMDMLGTAEDDVLEKVNLSIEMARLRQVVDTVLDPREQKVIRLRYGLDNGVCHTQREVAAMLDISRSYVSRLEKKAVRRITQEFNKGRPR